MIMLQKHVASWVALLGFAALAACSSSNQSAEAAVTDTTTTPFATNAPAAPVALLLNHSRQFSIATTETISSRTAKAGDSFTAAVVADVRDEAGEVAIPEGSMVAGMVTDVTSAPNSLNSGTLTLVVSSVTVRGKNYRIEARIDSLATGAIGRQVITRGMKGTIIGAVVGAAAGAGVAAATKDNDIHLPAGTRVMVTLAERLTITGT